MAHRVIDSDALDRVAPVLGISSDKSSAGTRLGSEDLTQVLSVNELVRRARTQGLTDGWFHCALRTIHAGAGAISVSIDPYDPGDDAFAPYPSPVPRSGPNAQDFYILTASLIRNSGAAALDGAMLFIVPAVNQQGWGRNSAGATVTTTLLYPLVRWTGLDSTLNGVNPSAITGDGAVMVKLNLRIGGNGLRLTTDADAASEFTLLMTCGLFTAGLGQDIGV